MSPAIIAVACALSTPASAGVEAIGPRGALTGFAITDGEGLVAEIQLGPGGAITARRATTRGGSLVLSGLDGGEAARFSRDSRVTVTTGDRWPRVEFDIGIEAFDEAAWQRAHGTVPFHYLLCETPGATFHYQGGGLIPAPEVDPFPISAKGFMAGNWADGWSYAPAMAGWAVPTVGMWNHVAGEFVAYDFSEARHTDRSSRLIAPAYCANEGGDPFFCLVHPYQRNWVELTCPETPTRAASHFELIYTRDLPDTADPNQFVLERLWNEKRDLLQPVPAMNDLAWIPEFDAGAPNGGLEPTAAGAQLRGFSSERGLEGIFVEPGTTMLGNTFVSDGIMRARSSGDEAQLARLREDVDYLLPRVKWVDIGGDRCATWVHPAEGTFKGQWGGEACAGNHHPSTFHIGTGLLLLHDITGDEALLPYIDGVYNWCKHY
ncbi:MAG TPA: hypothetical protein QGH10_27425, partial [Armatimonadota bacterium]|nr:hypothetical protein [Armatimonadota bacterium]